MVSQRGLLSLKNNMAENKNVNSSEQNLRNAGKHMAVGFNMAVGMGVFAYGGYKLDQKYEGVFFTILGVVFGCIYIAYESWKLIKNSSE